MQIRWSLAFFASCLFVVLLGCVPQQRRADNTFYTYVREHIHSLDPIHAHDLFSHQMSAQVYEGLYHFAYLKRPLTVEPLLASALPNVSADGLVYTISLKKNIYFHDHPCFPQGKGRLFVAEDFIYSLKRLADPKNRSESFWVIENKIMGLDIWRAQGADYAQPISGLQAIDNNTLQIRLTKPNYQFVQSLTMAATAVVPHEAVKYYAAEFGTHAVGTGAFQLEQWLPGSQLLFVKYSRYSSLTYPQEATSQDQAAGLLVDQGRVLPFLDKVVVYEIPEAQPQWLLFIKGDIDLLSPQKDYQDYFIERGQLKERWKNQGLFLELPPGLDVTFIGLNNENPFLKNKKIRQAFSLAFDRAFIVAQYYNFLAQPAHGPIPPGIDGYEAQRLSEFSLFDLTKAKKILADAGYPEGRGLPEFQYEIPSTHANARQLAEFFKQQLNRLGVRVRLNANTWPQFNDKVKKGKADIFDYAWNADYPDAENFFQLLYSKNKSPGPNAVSFDSKKFDQLYEKALSLPPGTERTQLYGSMEKLIMEECPWIFGVHRLRPLVKHGWLLNYKYEIMIPDTMKYLRIDQRQRLAWKGLQP